MSGLSRARDLFVAGLPSVLIDLVFLFLIFSSPLFPSRVVLIWQLNEKIFLYSQQAHLSQWIDILEKVFGIVSPITPTPQFLVPAGVISFSLGDLQKLTADEEGFPPSCLDSGSSDLIVLLLSLPLNLMIECDAEFLDNFSRWRKWESS